MLFILDLNHSSDFSPLVSETPFLSPEFRLGLYSRLVWGEKWCSKWMSLSRPVCGRCGGAVPWAMKCGRCRVFTFLRVSNLIEINDKNARHHCVMIQSKHSKVWAAPKCLRNDDSLISLPFGHRISLCARQVTSCLLFTIWSFIFHLVHSFAPNNDNNLKSRRTNCIAACIWFVPLFSHLLSFSLESIEECVCLGPANKKTAWLRPYARRA